MRIYEKFPISNFLYYSIEFSIKYYYGIYRNIARYITE